MKDTRSNRDTRINKDASNSKIASNRRTNSKSMDESSNKNNNNTVMPAMVGRPATVRTSENKEAPATAGMPETDGCEQ
jgi:hypothetical protein